MSLGVPAFELYDEFACAHAFWPHVTLELACARAYSVLHFCSKVLLNFG